MAFNEFQQKFITSPNDCHSALLATAGCITGDTIVNLNRASKGYKTTLENAYKTHNGLNKMAFAKRNKSTPTMIRAFVDGEIRLHEIEDIVYSGEKEVWELKLVNGKKIKATPDHKILTREGFVRLDNLSDFDEVVCDRLYARGSGNKAPKRRDRYVRHLNFYPYGCKDGEKRRVEEYRLIYDANKNGITLEEIIEILRRDESKAKLLKLTPPDTEIHHKDFDHMNNTPENLEAISKKEHDKIHSEFAHKQFYQSEPLYSNVLSITKIGVRKTYDICCKAPHHNFVANGIVVHNSGKTTSVVGRVKHLIEVEGMVPHQIITMTFSKKAAVEMNERFSKSGLNVKARTIHSMSLDMWNQIQKRTFTSAWRTPKSFELTAKGKFVGEFYKKLKTHKWGSSSLDFFFGAVSKNKKAYIKPEQYKEIAINEYNCDADLFKAGITECGPIEGIYHFYVFYEEFKKREGCIDFDDMLCNCLDVLKDPATSKHIKSLYRGIKNIIVDESQDTSTIAFMIVDELIRILDCKMTLVGDLRQVIYTFAGADKNNVPNFLEKYPTTVYDLPINYRSSKTIVEQSNNFIYSHQQFIGMKAIPHSDVETPIWNCESPDCYMEAQFICDQYEKHIAEGKRPDEIVVLYRVHSQSAPIIDELHQRGIPYYSYAKQEIYHRKEVKDILAYLLIADSKKLNKRDFGFAFKRISNKPLRYLNDAFCQDYTSFIYDNELDVTAAYSNYDFQNNYQDKNVFNFTNDIKAIRKLNTLEEKIRYILDDDGVGYLAHIKSLIDADDIADDNESDFEMLIMSANRHKNIDELMAYFKAMEESTNNVKETDNVIKLMSIHRSKGLEWPTVIIASVCHRFYPFYRCESSEERQEEARLFYVAMTRPEHKLLISSINGSFGRFKVYPSSYLKNFSQKRIVNDSIGFGFKEGNEDYEY